MLLPLPLPVPVRSSVTSGTLGALSSGISLGTGGTGRLLERGTGTGGARLVGDDVFGNHVFVGDAKDLVAGDFGGGAPTGMGAGGRLSIESSLLLLLLLWRRFGVVFGLADPEK